MTEQASLPYAGTSGWSGAEASRTRADERDSDGRTGRIQGKILRLLRMNGTWGVTIKQLRNPCPTEPHGTLSGSLTALHKSGRVARLTEQRDKCSVYVLPAYVRDREAV